MKRLIAAAISRLPFYIRGLRYGSSYSTNTTQTSPCPCHNRLRRFVESRTTGRGIWKWNHYFDAYEKHFNKFVGKEISILEVGIFNGGSLEMWKDYFGPQSQIYGVDIEPACKAYEDETAKVFIGDQANREFWRGIKAQVQPLDIVIDDGGHEPGQQIVTLEEMLPHIRPGGVYMCEDIHGPGNPFHLYVSGLSAQLNGGTMRSKGKDLETQPNPLQASIASITLYPYLCVIETRQQPINSLSCTRHGDSWQPFL